jgi:hypothetical protein
MNLAALIDHRMEVDSADKIFYADPRKRWRGQTFSGTM